MKNFTLREINESMLESLRSDWARDLANEDSIIIMQMAVDNIIKTRSFGDVRKRPHLSTYISVVAGQGEEDSDIVALVEVIYSSHGRDVICKIMDFVYSPAIIALDESAFIKQHAAILFEALYGVLSLVLEKGAGHAKIYARDDAAQKTIELIRQVVDNEELKKVKLRMTSEGHQWLKFELLQQNGDSV